MTEKSTFLKQVWPANSALFFSRHYYFTTVKHPYYIGYVQLLWWSRGATGPRFNTRLWQRFLCLIFYVIIVDFVRFVPSMLFFTKFLPSLAMLIYLAYLTYCKYCDRFKGYHPFHL